MSPALSSSQLRNMRLTVTHEDNKLKGQKDFLPAGSQSAQRAGNTSVQMGIAPRRSQLPGDPSPNCPPSPQGRATLWQAHVRAWVCSLIPCGSAASTFPGLFLPVEQGQRSPSPELPRLFHLQPTDHHPYTSLPFGFLQYCTHRECLTAASSQSLPKLT